MNKPSLRVLLVEDDECDFLLTLDLLNEISTFNCKTEWAATYSAAKEAITQKNYDVCLFDYRLGEHTGLDLLREAVAEGFRTPTILLTGQEDHEIDLEAMKAGAADYLIKGKAEVVTLERAIRYAMERKAAENALEESAKRERAMIENAPDLICTINADGHFVTISAACLKICGFQPEEMIGRSYLDLVAPEDATQTNDLAKLIFAGEKVTNFENRCRHKNGTLVNLRWTAHWSEKEQLIFAVAHDITELKRSEEELQRVRDAALESARLKSEFLANMSHEIRTPMNGIIGMTGLIMKTELSEKQQVFTKNIEMSADSLLTIINDILDFSKIEAGHLRFDKIDFDLREAVELPIELLFERAQSKRIRITSQIDGKMPTQLKGDPGRLRQILTNLIGNAVKFTAQGNVAVKVQLESETKNNVIARFEITDTGIGIAAESQRKLFQPFVQGDGSTTRKYGGTGLGLAISKQLVELMGGDIGVESTLGCGSTFWFTARFEKQLTPAKRESSEKAISLAGKRVLIVDDNKTNREILVHQTVSWGMIVVEADSGADALNILRTSEKPFDFGIMDMMMPEMDGFELARAVKSEPMLAHIHLILLPSYGKRGDGQKARDAGIAAYLQKPVRGTQLYNCLLTVLQEAAAAARREYRPPRLITQHSLRTSAPPKQIIENAASKIHILVAEDNAINREVVLNQLEYLGYQPDIVKDGREAVEMLRKQKYDVVLMDCQMPELDGFEATAEIRQLAGESRDAVIIAMTANALEGDRESCLAAGMNDYLSKPVKTETLRQMLERWGTQAEKECFKVFRDENENSVSSSEVFDCSVLESFRMMQKPDKPSLVNKIIELFIEGTEKNLTLLKQGSAVADPETIKRHAHGIKGSAGNIGARQMAAVCAELEQKAEAAAEAEILISRLECGFKQIVKVLDAVRQQENKN